MKRPTMKQSDSPTTETTRSVRGTAGLGRRLAQRLEPGDCVALVGPLGAGKTALVRGLAVGLGLADPKLVSSPTYVLVHEYPCRVPVHHIDLYRTADAAAELLALGLDEMLAGGIALIEWADRAAPALPHPHWRIDITITAATAREFHIRRVP